jgi:hypothetical protein
VILILPTKNRVMKQLFLFCILLIAVSVVSAQSSPRTQNARAKATTETKTSTTEHQAKAEVADDEEIIDKEENTNQNFGSSPAVGFANNTTIVYKNGQFATPSGHEAMAMGSGYSFFKKAVEKRLTTGNEANSGIFIRDNSSIGNNVNIMMHGQTATLSGHEATAVNGGYASFGRKNPWNVSQNDSKDEIVNERDPANNIIIYKKNGQAATKTGHEATGMGSGYSFSKKDK